MFTHIFALPGVLQGSEFSSAWGTSASVFTDCFSPWVWVIFSCSFICLIILEYTLDIVIGILQILWILFIIPKNVGFLFVCCLFSGELTWLNSNSKFWPSPLCWAAAGTQFSFSALDELKNPTHGYLRGQTEICAIYM